MIFGLPRLRLGSDMVDYLAIQNKVELSISM